MTLGMIPSIHTRLTLAFSVSTALHIALMFLPNFFVPSEMPPPHPKSWRMDVRVAPHGEGSSHQFAAPQIRQEAAKGTGKTPRENLPSLPKTQHSDAALKPVKNTTQQTENQIEKPPTLSAESKSVETLQQADALAGAMTNMVNMQYLLGQMRIFQALSRTYLKSTVQAQFTEEMLRQYIGAVCTVTLTYATQEGAADAKVDCGERRDLADILFSRINWGAVPQPDKYFLAYQRMHITIWFEGYWVNVGLKAGD